MLQYLPILFLSWTQWALSSPLTVSSPSALTSTNTNLTNGMRTVANLSTVPIPRDFKILPLFERPWDEPKEAYYYNTISALAEVALQNFDGVMPEQNFRTRRFPRLAIELVTPTGSTPIQTKYVVWGLLLSILIMDARSDFQWRFFSLLWQGEEVGGIGFGPIRPRNPTAKVITTDALISGDNPVTNSTAYQADANADRVDAVFDPYGRALDQGAVFMAIVSALSDAAAKPADERVTGIFNSFFVDYHCQVTARETTPVRTTPPYYTFTTLIKSLVLAADYFVTNNDYRQVRMLVKVNDFPVANTLIIWKEDPHLATLGGDANGSTATA